MNPFLFPLADLSTIPTKTDLGLYPAIVMLVGIIFWAVAFTAKRNGHPKQLITILAYLVLIAASLVGYFSNQDYFNPVIFDAQNYWSNQSKAVLILAVILPLILIVVFVIADYVEGKRIAREEDT